MLIINLTQHPATAEQQEAGVQDLPTELREKLKTLLTFEEIPTPAQLQSRAKEIVDLLEELDQMPTRALIGGAPFFMGHLEEELRNAFVIPTYAFSKRVTTEVTQPDGSVVKTAIFHHIGFVDV